MNYTQFTNKLYESFTQVFNNTKDLITNLLDNHFIKTIVFIILAYFVIELVFDLITIILNIFSQKTSALDEKVINKTTDIE